MTENASYAGVVQGGVVVMHDPRDLLPEGTAVMVTPISEERGSPKAILAALARSPKVPPEWVDDLEAAIESGSRPPSFVDPFSEETGEHGVDSP